MTDTITIHRITPQDKTEWLRMRSLLWPHANPAEHLAEMEEMLTLPEELPVFIALRPNGSAAGFLEGSTRRYADGCHSSPVGYIEGWFVEEDQRRQGIGAALVRALEDWARQKGLSEIGSDTWLDNQVSISAHKRLGYVDVERLVHFLKKL